MIDNTGLLRDLLAQGKIRLSSDSILSKMPSPLPANFDFSKVEGMLLGLAIGDALGATSEGKAPEDRRKAFGEVRDYLPGKRSKYRPVGVPTDDTQLSFWTLEQLIEDGGLIPDNLARRFLKHHIQGIGTTTTQFIRNYKDKGIPWYEAGVDSLGNGVLMRISPILVPYLTSPHPSMYADAALDAMTTHNSFANTSCCVAFIDILWKLLSMKSAPEPSWWLDTYCSIAEKAEGKPEYTSRIPEYGGFHGALWQFTNTVVSDALYKNISTVEACNSWGSGANLLETVPSVIYILAKHANNLEEAIIRAVNDTKDNDTVASIVGAAVGALHGSDAIPKRWINGLTGRTTSSDDGHIFKLILMARQKFWNR